MDPTTDILAFFRNLNVFVRNKKRFSQAQGDGRSPQRLWAKPLRGKTSGFFGLLFRAGRRSAAARFGTCTAVWVCVWGFGGVMGCGSWGPLPLSCVRGGFLIVVV
ncbi:hypothetical protein B9Q08_02270 [Candidatus Marsarchaeota G2 archaeon ECH_B_SAG-M15]|uniref:Uncharacterized protein n=1 Tax=Candidatus Marsarchaeota G2 archaeon ECH_B_SAG-M15 TaxID=1978162 RepID=A0A2R6AZG8_9ARCH|nr:MAG: hypothetical protein B9Q08_02270 [Candidatus Marsarchaeota G2 archaeon ECH_B_SAG-M15]